ITGATGNVGREIVNLLLAEGRHVVAVSRNPATAQLPSNAHVITGDPSRPQTLATALKGAEAVLLSPRPLAGAARQLATLAAANGARHAVVLSSLTVQYGGGLQRFADEFRTIEDVVKNSGLEWTVLRSADYASNAKAWIAQIQAGDVVRGAYGEAKSSTVHERDVAAVAARSLIGAAHAGQTY